MTSTTSHALLPCPFCQSTTVHLNHYCIDPDNFHNAFVECYDCEAQGRHAASIAGWLSSKEEALEEAAAAWNKRGGFTPTDDKEWAETLKVRDHYHEWADKLAEAVGNHFNVDIGEHSSANLPWERALAVLEQSAAAKAKRQPAEEGSPLYAWLVKVSKCGLPNAEAAAAVLKDYYEGVESPISFIEQNLLQWKPFSISPPDNTHIIWKANNQQVGTGYWCAEDALEWEGYWIAVSELVDLKHVENDANV